MARTGRRSLAITGAVVSICLLFSACSSSGSKSTSASSQVGGASGSSPAANSCLATAQANVAKARAAISPNIPTDKLDVSSLKGKTIYDIVPTLTSPTNADSFKGSKAAAATIGLTVRSYDAQGTVTGYNQGVSEAVAGNAGGIIVQGLPADLISGPLAQASSKKIPVIDYDTGSPSDPLKDGLLAHVVYDAVHEGATMADYVLASTSCKADADVLTSSLYPVLNEQNSGFKAEYQKLCPKCKLLVSEVDFTKQATDVPQMVSTAISKDPSLNYIVCMSDNVTLYAAPAAAARKPGIKVLGDGGSAPVLAMVRQGDVTADIAQPPAQYIGWLEVDILLHAMLGSSSLPSGTFTTQLFDSTNIGTSSDPDTMFPNFAGYEAKFTSSWGQ